MEQISLKNCIKAFCEVFSNFCSSAIKFVALCSRFNFMFARAGYPITRVCYGETRERLD